MLSLNLKLLCIHKFFCDPTEVKDAFLRGGRAYNHLFERPGAFAIDLFDEDVAEERGKAYLKHVGDVQLSYHWSLLSLGFPESSQWHEPLGQDATWKLIQANHRALAEMDGTQSSDQYEEFLSKCDDGFPLNGEEGAEFSPDRLAQFLLVASSAREAWVQLSNHVSEKHPKVLLLKLSANITAYELMAFLTHISRAVVFGYGDRVDEALDDYRAAIGHIKRAILDYQKAVILTTLSMHRRKLLGIEDVMTLLRSLCAARQEEVALSASQDGKIDFYTEVVNGLLPLHGITIRIPGLKVE